MGSTPCAWPAGVKVSDTLAVRSMPPLFPVMRRERVPGYAARLEATRRMEVPWPMTEAGVKLAEDPEAKPLTRRATLPENPPEALTATV